MTDFQKSNKIGRLLICLVVLLLPILLCFCASGEESVTEIKSAIIKNDRNKVKIEVTLSDEDFSEQKGSELCLVSLDSSSQTDGVAVVAKAKAKKKMSFTLKLDKLDEDFLSSALALATRTVDELTGKESFALITAPKYVENTAIVATKNNAPIQSGEIKGFSGIDALDASAVGASNLLIEVNINEFMLPSYKTGAINYVFDGNSYYFDGEKLEALDKQIREANLLSQRVYLRTVIAKTEDEGIFDKLSFGGAPKSAEGLIINHSSPEALTHLRAFYTFFGARYNNNDMLVTDYIIGKEVNRYAKNCYAPSAEDFEQSYFVWLCTAGNVLLEQNRNVKIYVSVDNRLRTDDSDAIGAKVFLQKLSTNVKSSGGIPFDIAISLGNGKDIGDILAGANKDISLVNANSFALVSELLSSEEMLIDGKERGVIIDSLHLPVTMTEQNRATYYAYTYYKAAEAGFDAFFFTADENGGIMNAEGERRDLFYVAYMCGSSYYQQVYDYLGRLQGGSIPKLIDYVFTSADLEDEIPDKISNAATRNKRAFPADISAFEPIGSTYDTRLSSEGGKTTLTLSSDISLGSGGAVIGNISAKGIIEAGYIGIDMYCADVCDIELIITAEGKEGRVSYIGKARVGSVEKTYYFNITELTDHLKPADTLTLSLIVPEDAEYTTDALTVTDIALYGNSGNGSSTVITVILVALGTLAICGLLFLLTKRRSNRLRRRSALDES